MEGATLILHRGAREVRREELENLPPPQQEGRYFPIAHATVLDRVKGTLAEAGFVVRKERLGLTADNAKFFGALDLENDLAVGVKLAVAVRSATDRSTPLGFCAGSRTVICDNGLFHAELMVKRKHTRFGAQHFQGDIAAAINKLGDFQKSEAKRIELLAGREINNGIAEALLLRAFDKGIIPAQLLPKAIQEWRKPSFPEFEPRTAWSLVNAMTTALGPRATSNPTKYATTTMRLGALFAPIVAGAADWQILAA